MSTAMALLGAGRSKEWRLLRGVGQVSRQRPVEPGVRKPFQGESDSGWRNTYSPSNLVEPDPRGL
jgi:hypothetical protein